MMCLTHKTLLLIFIPIINYYIEECYRTVDVQGYKHQRNKNFTNTLNRFFE